MIKKTIIYIVLAICMIQISNAQSIPVITSNVDSTTVKIGEAITYKMQVEVDSTTMVVFPEGKTFMPLEVIESFKVDTTKKENKLQLIKEYALTQFDSGHYTIPRQKVLIGDQIAYTDSLKIEIRDVIVDTTKQKLYEIKPMIAVEAPFGGINFTWGIIIVVVIALIAAIVFFWKKKKEEKLEEELPPYERAMLTLKKVDESSLLEEDSYKEYYSIVTDAARKYLNEEVYDHAMESTTEELITILEEQSKSGALQLDKETIKELKRVLQTADLAKFAKTITDQGTAKADRNSIEQIINETKEAIPEPTEEELLDDEEYKNVIASKKKKKQLLYIGSGILGTLIIVLSILVYINGFHNVKDTIMGHPSKKLSEQEWISSSYGLPSVTVATPEVLIRNNYQLTEEQKQVLKGNETFVYGDILKNLFVEVSTVKYEKDTEIDLNKTVEAVVGQFESRGAKNISVKDEEYKTLGGAEGIRIFGEFDIENAATHNTEKREYVMLNFAEKGGFQQVIIVSDSEDRYVKNIVDRIANSVELKSVE